MTSLVQPPVSLHAQTSALPKGEPLDVAITPLMVELNSRSEIVPTLTSDLPIRMN